ncbi:coiled-coil-helix-coiled-coil-helix domain-containing protein 7 isoform X2 [Terrapene carolina triunguis]|uniref:coiled-coil-helix-coiled-coil-helix domain-containing protein 7 isoform X2 n=1 Tax=Terrapene triunguis TaxID=2587831 RepID=UPI000E774032|nr:coiled-coil-helix-coiled-coil-helix domain-containing protein 7 isoform X2 [Terrapene carolina triunguis]
MSRNVQRLRDHDTNPCLVETDASRQCMDDNNYRKDMCASYFLKYKNCRKFWTKHSAVGIAAEKSLLLCCTSNTL